MDIWAVTTKLIGTPLFFDLEPYIHVKTKTSDLETQGKNSIDLSQGVYIIDRYTYYALEFLEGVERGSKKTMGQLLEVCPQRLCMSTVGNRTDLFPRDPYQVKIIHTFYFMMIW